MNDVVRVCEWCHEPFEPHRPHARFCSDVCRVRAWKASRDDSGSVTAVERVPRSRSGLQVPYRRGVKEVAAYLRTVRFDHAGTCEEIAELVLAKALPAAQRERLTNRGGRV